MIADFNSDHLAALLRLNRDGADKIVSVAQFYSVMGHFSFHTVLTDLMALGLAEGRPATRKKDYVYSITARGQELVRNVVTQTRGALAA